MEYRQMLIVYRIDRQIDRYILIDRYNFQYHLIKVTIKGNIQSIDRYMIVEQIDRQTDEYTIHMYVHMYIIYLQIVQFSV